MASQKLLVVDDNEDYPSVSGPHRDLVEFREALEDPSAIQWSKYAVVFSHTRNDAADRADERFENGVIDGLFVFSGGEDAVSEHLGVYTLPRPLFKRRFNAFLERYANGESVETCTEVFLARSFERGSPKSSGTDGPSTAAGATRAATFTHSEKKPPPWCSTAFPLRTRTDDGSVLSVNGTLRPLRDLDDVHTIVLRDTYFSDGDGLDLLLHLRLSVGDDLMSMRDYSRYPVLVQLTQSLEAWLRRDSDFSILTTQGVRLLSSEDDVAPHLLADPAPLDPEGEHLPMLEALSLSPTGLKSRHDLANEWGPIQFWNGLRQLSASDLSFPNWVQQSFQHLTQQRYYKYLFGLSALRGETRDRDDGRQTLAKARGRYEEWTDVLEQRDTPLRLGLIEDEAEKGWTDALGSLFADVEDRGTVEAPYEDPDFQDVHELARDVKRQPWDAVLVDLRLTESDREASTRRADELSGVQLIKNLKKDRPDLPIVAFTASNKAWTAKALRAAGADGYWIKESPEHGVRPAYTLQNASDLIGTLQEVLHRYENAQPIWTLVTDLRTLKNKRDKLASFASLTTERDPYGEVRTRLTAIENRLRRAFGYLVMESTAHEEDAFAFNRQDLAFLTTWSVLNEVTSLYFSDPPYRGKDLSETRREHNFQLVNPENQSVETYWRIENGRITDDVFPMPTELESYLRPTKENGKPEWPPQSKDNPRVQWLLHLAGAPDLALRMHDDDFRENQYDVNSAERPPLRDLRNHLEESHGEISKVWHAELQDVYDLLDIWRTILPV